MNALITGGAGFIGSHLVRLLLHTGVTVLNLDKLGYASHPGTLADVADHPRYSLRQVDLCEAAAVRSAVDEFRPSLVMHLAAETHVDRSIDGPRAFVHSNIVGTYNLLQACLMYWRDVDAAAAEAFRFLHVSTDEVFGALGAEGRFDEHSPYDPHSPYAATKAASDHLARAWHVTYGLPVIVTHCSNNYGPYQHPEKLIPTVIARALRGEAIPVYGTGQNVRDWIYVEDHCRALWAAAGADPGTTFTIGADCGRRNIDLVGAICGLLDELRPREDRQPYASQIEFVADRPGHDFRYALDASRIRRERGWQPQQEFSAGLRKTVQWYVANEPWWSALVPRGVGRQGVQAQNTGLEVT